LKTEFILGRTLRESGFADASPPRQVVQRLLWLLLPEQGSDIAIHREMSTASYTGGAGMGNSVSIASGGTTLCFGTRSTRWQKASRWKCRILEAKQLRTREEITPTPKSVAPRESGPRASD